MNKEAFGSSAAGRAAGSSPLSGRLRLPSPPPFDPAATVALWRSRGVPVGRDKGQVLVSCGGGTSVLMLSPGEIGLYGEVNEAVARLLIVALADLQSPAAHPEGNPRFLFHFNAAMARELHNVRKTEPLAFPYLVAAIEHAGPGDQVGDLFRALGHALRVRGQLEAAAMILSRGAEACPNDVDLRVGLGDMAQRLGDHEAASRVYATFANPDASPPAGVPRCLFRSDLIFRFLGETAAKLDIYVKACALGLLPQRETLLAVDTARIANPAYLDYWRDHLTFVTDRAAAAHLLENFTTNHFYPDYYRMEDGRYLRRDLAHTVVQQAWEAQGRGPLLTLSAEHRERSRPVLADLGIPADGWFVTLHVRESGFRNDVETPLGLNAGRNGDIDTYADAIRAITDRGGWVVRLGDPSMRPLPAMPGLVDYAHSTAKSDWMDVALIAQSRFFLGMASGPSSVAVTFGIPTVGTNWFPLGYWPYVSGDIFIHKRLETLDGLPLTIAQSLQPPLLGALESELFRQRRLRLVDNSPDEIAAAVIEMMDRLDGRIGEPDPQVELYMHHADPCGLGCNARVSRYFVAKHASLLAGLPQATVTTAQQPAISA